MAELRTNVSAIDPVWDQIMDEARMAVDDEPLIGALSTRVSCITRPSTRR